MRKIFIIVFCTLCIVLFSCQEEKNEIIQQNNNSLTASAPLYDLVARVAQNRTSQDNIIDNSNCFSVQLPVQVIVNGQQIDIVTTADYQLVQDAIDAFSTDDDVVTFVFPITVQLQNFQLQTINNSNHYNNLLDDCDEEDNGFSEIDCIDINYPIVFNTFDSVNQITNTITIQTDADLYQFLENLNPSIFVSINYPISITDSNGQNIVINSNEELESVIEAAIEECSNNSGSGSGGGLTLESVLIDGSWYVSYFFKNNVDDTSDFDGYVLTFASNETMNVSGNGNAINGTWDINSNASERKLEFDLEGNTLIRLEEKWKVVEYSNTMIKLRLVGQVMEEIITCICLKIKIWFFVNCPQSLSQSSDWFFY